MAALMGTIDGIVRRSAGAPVLAGALDHWLKRNIENFHDNRLEPVMPLLSDMAQQGSPALRHQAVALVSNLVVRGSYPVRDIYRAVFRLGTPSLRLALVDSFVAFWPQLSPDALRIFIDCCDPRQDLEVIDRLGDVFSLHVASEPEAVLVYLDRAISPLSFMSVTEPQRVAPAVTLRVAVHDLLGLLLLRPAGGPASRARFRARKISLGARSCG
jgi:hypothetical protein